MPRICDSNNKNHDLCRFCYRQSKPQWGRLYGPNADTDVEHPPYDDDDYRCDICSHPLTEVDQ